MSADPGTYRPKRQFLGDVFQRSPETALLDLAVTHLAEQPCEPLQLNIHVADVALIEQSAEDAQSAAQPPDRHTGVVNGVVVTAQSEVACDDLVDLSVQVFGESWYLRSSCSVAWRYRMGEFGR